MPQMQLPIFPPGVTEINHQIAVLKEAGTVYYIHGHLPVFRHAEKRDDAFDGASGGRAWGSWSRCPSSFNPPAM
jgi:hypothetical protein